FARIDVGHTVGQALERIRNTPPGGRIVYFYVVDADGRLHGVVPTRRLLLTSPATPVSEIMIREVVTLPETATVLDACEFFILHRFLAFPVVDQAGRIRGVIDVELYTDELSELGGSLHDDLFQLIGVHVAEARITSSWSAFRYRFPWLLCNIVGGILAALLTGLFAEDLKTAVALASFIPVVLALAESVSIQSLSLSLQALHGPTPALSVLVRRMRRELTTGVALGTASALFVGLAAMLWLKDATVVSAVGGGIIAGVTVAAVLGFGIPHALRLLRLDPQIAAGPLTLATTDMITLLAYLSLAHWLLRL
ncbi:MAG: magnesium transporter, partial [Planctomycetota bacterium]